MVRQLRRSSSSTIRAVTRDCRRCTGAVQLARARQRRCWSATTMFRSTSRSARACSVELLRVHAVNMCTRNLPRRTLSLVGDPAVKVTMAKALVGLVPHKPHRDQRPRWAILMRRAQGGPPRPADRFQDPMALDARMTVGELIREPLRSTALAHRRNRRRVRELLERVELSVSVYNRYPHQFSGGQRRSAHRPAEADHLRRERGRARRVNPGRCWTFCATCEGNRHLSRHQP